MNSSNSHKTKREECCQYSQQSFHLFLLCGGKEPDLRLLTLIGSKPQNKSRALHLVTLTMSRSTVRWSCRTRDLRETVKNLLRDGLNIQKKKVVCQEKSTTRYGRVLLICSVSGPAPAIFLGGANRDRRRKEFHLTSRPQDF